MSLLYRSAFGIAEDIKSQQISAVEALTFFLERIDTFNGDINAVVAMAADDALARARAADEAADRGEDWGPLHGVP
ncbi:MAG: amidase family protein, partial [Chromatocurvus sp.]